MEVEQVDIVSPSTMIQSTHRSGGVTSLWGLIIPSVGAQCSDDGYYVGWYVLARRPQRPSSYLYEWNCPWNLCSYWGMIVSLRQNSRSLKASLYTHPREFWLAIWSIAFSFFSFARKRSENLILSCSWNFLSMNRGPSNIGGEGEDMALEKWECCREI